MSCTSYGYHSHLQPRKRNQPKQIGPRNQGPIFASRAAKLVNMAPKDRAAHPLVLKYPLLARYFELAAALEREHVLNNANHSFSGVHRHLGRLFGWPVTEDEWDEARSSFETVRVENKSLRGQSSTYVGERADNELQRIIKGELVPAKATHKLTKWMMLYLYERQWLPVGAQVPLWSEDGRSVCTWIDIVCYDLNTPGRLVLIEQKTGYKDNYEAMRTVLGAHGFIDSHYNRHQLQLGWMHSRFAPRAKEYGLSVESLVVRVDGTSGIQEPLPLDAKTLAFYETDYVNMNTWTLASDDNEEEKPVVVVPSELVEVPMKRNRKRKAQEQ